MAEVEAGAAGTSFRPRMSHTAHSQTRTLSPVPENRAGEAQRADCAESRLPQDQMLWRGARGLSAVLEEKQVGEERMHSSEEQEEESGIIVTSALGLKRQVFQSVSSKAWYIVPAGTQLPGGPSRSLLHHPAPHLELCSRGIRALPGVTWPAGSCWSIWSGALDCAGSSPPVTVRTLSAWLGMQSVSRRRAPVHPEAAR